MTEACPICGRDAAACGTAAIFGRGLVQMIEEAQIDANEYWRDLLDKTPAPSPPSSLLVRMMRAQRYWIADKLMRAAEWMED